MKFFACLLVVLTSACSPLYGDGPTTPSRETTSSSGSESSDTSSPAYQAGRREAELRAQLAASAREREAAIEAARRLGAQLAAERRNPPAAPQAQPGPAPAAAPLPIAPMAVAGGLLGGFPGMGLGSSGQIPVHLPMHGVVGNVGWVNTPTPAEMRRLGRVPVVQISRGSNIYATQVFYGTTQICLTDGSIDPRTGQPVFPMIMTESGQRICVWPGGPAGGYANIRFELARGGGATLLLSVITGPGFLRSQAIHCLMMLFDWIISSMRTK